MYLGGATVPGMSPVLTQVLAWLFLVVIAAAALSAVVIAVRQRGAHGASQDRAQLAAELIELEEELNYAEALASTDPVVAENLARAHTQLNQAFAVYNRQSAVNGEGISTGQANDVRGRITMVRQFLAHPAAPSTGPLVERETSLIVDTQIAPVISNGTRVFQVALWVLGVIPGLVLMARKTVARNYFAALDQRIKTNAAQIDVFLERRLQILRNCPGFSDDIDPALNVAGVNVAGVNGAALNVAALNVAGAPVVGPNATGPIGLGESGRNVTNGRIDRAYQVIMQRAAGQSFGELAPALQSALRADRNVQREITAARTLYNDTVNMWNRDIFIWPAKMMVANEQHLTTRPVFVASQLSSAVELTGVR